MREFKLKKWYPSLPTQWKDEETIVVVQNDPFGYRLHPSLKRIVNTKIVSFEEVESSEYWQEMKPDLRDYEILKFISVDRNPAYTTLRKNGMYLNELHEGEDGAYTLENVLGKPNWKIFSIKRLSDGEIFSVGDSFTTTMGIVKTTIKEFYFSPDKMLSVKGTNTGQYSLASVVSLPKPILRTEEGISKSEGDIVYQVCTLPDTKWEVKSTKVRPEIANAPLYFKYFSTKVKAEGFIIRNKPVWSLQEIYDMFDPASINSRTKFISIIGMETKKKLKF